MAALHRALFTWFLCLVFLILLAVRLDEKTSWNWFIVFIPMWIFDSFLLIYVVFLIISHCKNGLWRTSLRRKSWYLLGVLLKMAFQTVLCIKFEYEYSIATYYVALPLWVLLTGLTLDVVTHLVGLR